MNGHAVLRGGHNETEAFLITGVVLIGDMSRPSIHDIPLERSKLGAFTLQTVKQYLCMRKREVRGRSNFEVENDMYHTTIQLSLQLYFFEQRRADCDHSTMRHLVLERTALN